MIGKLIFLLLLVAPLFGAPELGDNMEVLNDNSSSVMSGEILQLLRKVDLEDPAERSASSEVLDDNHAGFQRKRRSLKMKPMEAGDIDDLEAAESVVFMPAHLRLRKKMAYQDCRVKHEHLKSWKLSNPSTPEEVSWTCNAYCCYPVIRM